ncbi:unnamed protein product [Enterobius vermicularis]|uniref:Expressed conserved protein n=1 Tax=Enterobius vermicularis TaxID=51028 RepID=A0A0N4VM38_ENTVE|nr:unnamed protein product [Enterobius vermicularis]
MLVRKSADCFTYADETTGILHDDLEPLKDASTSFIDHNSDGYTSTDPELTVRSSDFPSSVAVQMDDNGTSAMMSASAVHSPKSLHRCRVAFSPSPQPNMAKHIIKRQLRKFASEANFAVVHENTNDSLESETVPLKGHQRIYTVRPNSTCSNRINGGGTLFGRMVRSRKTSEESGSYGSDATVASGSMTPVSAHRMTFKMRRPKSAGQMVHFPSELNASANSGTTQSFDSLQQLTVPCGNQDDRRPSNVYIDEDSAHEFDYEEGEIKSEKQKAQKKDVFVVTDIVIALPMDRLIVISVSC